MVPEILILLAEEEMMKKQRTVRGFQCAPARTESIVLD